MQPNNEVYVVVHTSVAYNDGYNMPDTPEKFYIDRSKAVAAAADLNIEKLFDRAMLVPFPDTDTFQVYRDKISWEYETAEEASKILKMEVHEGLQFLSELSVAELKSVAGELDILSATNYNYEGNWYGVATLKLAND